MSIDRFELILFDLYQMDAWMPPIAFKWKESFQKASWSRWALQELKEYITDRLYPRTGCSLWELSSITKEFMTKMVRFSKTNRKTSPIFQTAKEVAANVLDLLHAMM